MASPYEIAVAKAWAEKTAKTEEDKRRIFYDVLENGIPDAAYVAPPATPGGHERNADHQWWQIWKIGEKEKWWEVDPEAYKYQPGIPLEWQEMGGQAQTDWLRRASQLEQMRAGDDMRQEQLRAAYGIGQVGDLMGQRAIGGAPLISQMEAQRQLALGQGAIASRAATSMRGGYDPATARAAMYATGQLAGDVAGQAAIAAMQERNQAAQMMMQAKQAQGDIYGQMRGVDINQMIQMQTLAAQSRQLGQDYMLQYQGMGMGDKAAELQARMEFERAKMNGFFGKEVYGAIGPGLGSVGGALGAGALTDWDPDAMKLGASALGSVGAAASS